MGDLQYRQHSQAAQQEAKEKLKKRKWHGTTSPPHPSFGLPKRQHPTSYICPCQGFSLTTIYMHWIGIWGASFGLLRTKHFLLWKDEGFIGRGCQTTAVTAWAHLLPYYTSCTAFHSASASPPAGITHTVSDIYGTPYAFTPFPCLSQCIKIGLPANNLLFHMYQISGRCSMTKLTQVVLLWNNFLLEELSSYQKSPVCTESFTL